MQKFFQHDLPSFLCGQMMIFFLKSFGLGYDELGNRLAVVPLTYFKRLSPEHQVYWKGKECKSEGKVL